MGNVVWRYEQTIPEIPVLVGILACWATWKTRGVGLVICRLPSRKPENVAKATELEGQQIWRAFSAGVLEAQSGETSEASPRYTERPIWPPLSLVAVGFCRLFVCSWSRWKDYQTIDLSALYSFTTSEGIGPGEKEWEVWLSFCLPFARGKPFQFLFHHILEHQNAFDTI